MTSGKLDFSSLRNALARLAEGYQRYQTDVSDIQIRDGLTCIFKVQLFPT
jgi:hypothetical protein